jgi:hypothetical protein
MLICLLYNSNPKQMFCLNASNYMCEAALEISQDFLNRIQAKDFLKFLLRLIVFLGDCSREIHINTVYVLWIIGVLKNRAKKDTGTAEKDKK